ncbi:hypothetical protein MCEMSEM18_03481 [Comamonadaceae bacterium]
MPQALAIDRTVTMDQWSELQLLSHIQRLTPDALEMVDGMDCTAPTRIEHAREEIRIAVDLLQLKGYPFDFAARQKLKFINWLPTQVDMRMMIRGLLQGEQLEDGMFPGDYRLEIIANSYGQDASAQYKAMGEIIIAQTLRLGTDQREGARILIDQIPRAIHTGKCEITVPVGRAMWLDLADHLKSFPATNVNLRCTIPQSKGLTVSIKDLIESITGDSQSADRTDHDAANAATLPAPLASKTPKPRPLPWYLRLLGLT